jgi:Uma2 family endonuclease
MKVNKPEILIYEEMDGTPIYYKNYYKVLLDQASPEDIMGSSHSQAFVISVILEFLYRTLKRSEYWIATNEARLHASHGNNLPADIAIFDRNKLIPNHRDFNYITVAPKIVIEVDISADLSDFASPLDYYRKKSKKLMDFGVELVLWVDTMTETIMLNDELTSYSWHTPVPLMEGVEINVGELVKEF